MAGFIEGQSFHNRNPIANINSKASVGTTLTNIISFRVGRSFNSIENFTELLPHIITVGFEGTKPGEIHDYPNSWVSLTGPIKTLEFNRV